MSQEKMSIAEFNKFYEIDRKRSGLRAIPKSKVALEGEKKKHKYHAEPTERVIDNITVKFPSKKEALTYDKLKLLERAGEITELIANAAQSGENKIKYIFQIEPFKMWYEPDFQYLDLRSGEYVVADAKGVKTPEYIRKKRLMKKMFDIDILEY